jgi:hypothetical protein
MQASSSASRCVVLRLSLPGGNRATAESFALLTAKTMPQSTDESFDAAVDALCELVWSCVSPAAQGLPPQMLGHMLPMVQLLVSKVLLSPPLLSPVASALEFPS